MPTKMQGIPENATTAKDFSGHKVVDKEGIEYGRVRHVHIDENTLGIAGATVKYGFRKEYFLPRSSIERITNESVMITTPPIRIGVPVTDIDSHRIGKIKRINLNTDTGSMESIVVSSGVFSSKTISVSAIWGVGEAVTLKMTRAEFSSRS